MQIFTIHDWLDNSGTYYYHYTSIKNAKKIIEDQLLIAKVPKRNQYGSAVFFTKLKPNSNDNDLICNNYIHYSNKFVKKIECAFAINRNHIELQNINADRGRDVWCHRKNVNLKHVEFKLIIRKNKREFENCL